MTGTSTLTAAEVDERRRAAAVGPLEPADVHRVLESLREMLDDRLTPAWGELRGVLYEVNRVLEP